MKVSNWKSPAIAGFLKLGISRSCVVFLDAPKTGASRSEECNAKYRRSRFERPDRSSASHLRSRYSTDVDIRRRDSDVNSSIRLGRLVEEGCCEPARRGHMPAAKG